MWWDKLVQHGPTYGYLPNASKSWLIVKDAKHSEAHAVFQGSGVPITSKGKHYLGDAIGSESFVHSYVSEKVSEWITEYELLSQISLTQPHSAYAAFTRGVIFPKQYPIFNHYCNLWMMPSASHFFLVSWSKHIQLCQLRDLLALPARLGRLSVIILVDQSQLIFDDSPRLTRPVVDLILQQSTSLPFEVIEAQSTARHEIHHVLNSLSLSIVMSCLLSYQLS